MTGMVLNSVQYLIIRKIKKEVKKSVTLSSHSSRKVIFIMEIGGCFENT